MQDLRQALADVLGCVPGRHQRAVDVERALGLNKKLAWQVFRILNSETLSDIANVPSAASARTLMAAASERGVPAGVLKRVARAFERFDEFATTQAEDRAGLVTLVSRLGSTPNDAYELNIRKNAFRAMSHLWGAKCQMAVRSEIAFRNRRFPQARDVAAVSAEIGLQRMRENEPLGIVRYLGTDYTPGAKAETPAPPPKQMAAAMVDHGVDLLHEFCTQPLPRMEPKPSVWGGTETELIFPAGRLGALTIYSSHLRECAEMSPTFDMRAYVTVPVETIVLELLVPAGMADPRTVRGGAYGCRTHPEHVYDERSTDLLPQKETATCMTNLERVPPLPGSPMHNKAMEHVLEKCGWLGARFDVFRCRIQYPVLHTLVCLWVDAAR